MYQISPDRGPQWSLGNFLTPIDLDPLATDSRRFHADLAEGPSILPEAAFALTGAHHPDDLHCRCARSAR